MNPSPIILPLIEIPSSALPDWDQLPLECRTELIQTLAALLLHLPQLLLIEKGGSDEQRQ